MCAQDPFVHKFQRVNADTTCHCGSLLTWRLFELCKTQGERHENNFRASQRRQKSKTVDCC